MPAQMVRLPELSVALRARVVSALPVHRAHMRPQRADVPGLVVALRARVSARLSKLFHHPVAGEERSTQYCRDRRERSTVVEMDRMPNVRVGWTCELHCCIRKTQALRFSYRLSFIDINNV